MKLTSPAAEEFPFIYDSWAKSYRTSPWAGTVPNHLWDTVSRACATELIERGRVVVAVAELDDGARRVMGYSVSEPAKGVLHWLYVKRDYRGIGVGKELLLDVTSALRVPGPPMTYSHRTLASAKFLGSKWTHDAVTARVKS